MSLDEAREAYQSFHCCRLAGGRVSLEISRQYQVALDVFEDHGIDPDEDAENY